MKKKVLGLNLVQVHWRSYKKEIYRGKERAEGNWNSSEVLKDLDGNEKRKRELYC